MDIATPLLAWYHRHRRILPFREDPTPYHIWVSEIMLQQTRVAAALPYYDRFIKALPDPAALAACDEEALHKLWEGLGYYSRVRNMQKAARIVVEQYGGALPASYEALLSLPGIGEYTAGAIASIAFGLPVVAVDGNVLRVFARLLNCKDDVSLPATKRALAGRVQACQPPARAGDYNQAIMELGALVCIPGLPSCAACPLVGLCAGYKAGTAALLPTKPAKKAKKAEEYTVLVVRCGGKALVGQRPASGLLAGLWQPVLLDGRLSAQTAATKLESLLPGARLGAPLPAAKHIFTHKIWQMQGWQAEAPKGSPAPAGWLWADPGQIDATYTLPSAFRAFLPFLRGENTP